MIKNLWVFAGNFIPLLFNCFAILVAYSLSEPKVRKVMELSTVSLAVVLGGTGVLLVFTKTHEQATAIWGLLGAIVTVGMFVSPVASAKKIIQTKDASIIYLPLGFATLANCFMWTSYGIAIGPDWYVVQYIIT